jgi:hypothetical protein
MLAFSLDFFSACQTIRTGLEDGGVVLFSTRRLVYCRVLKKDNIFINK